MCDRYHPVQAAPPSASTLEAVTAGIEAAGAVFPALDLVRRRRTLLLANPDLQERELVKLASLATTLSEALRRRGVAEAAADLAAETGIAVLRIALGRWIADPAERPWKVHVDEAFDELRSLTANPTSPAPN